MKFIRYTAIALFSLIGIIVLTTLFLPSGMHVSRSIVIEAPREVVFEQVNRLQNWEQWSPWHQIDPDMIIIYTGPEKGLGAGYDWKSDHRSAGSGTLTILESIPNEKIVTGMDFKERGTGQATYTFQETAGGTRVTWEMHSEGGNNPLEKFMSSIIGYMIGKDFDKGLASLKNISEAQ